jgi:hypothetical protein
LLDDLITLRRSSWFEEGEGYIHLLEVWLEGDVLNLSLDFHSSEDDNDQSWKVECVGPLDHALTLGYCYEFELSFNHVLLWPYIHPNTSLSFHGEAKDPLAVVGALQTRHQALVGNWIPFGRYINGNPLEMIRGRYGMLIEGPFPLVQAYGRVLDTFGINNGMSELKSAAYRNDEAAGLEEIAALILNSESFVVAPKFNAQQMR